MRIAVVTPWDATDPAGWSGTVRPMVEALRDRADVVPVRVPQLGDHVVDRAAARLVGARGWGYLPGHAVATSRRLAGPVDKAVRASGADIVLSVAASTALAHADVDMPVVEVGDTTFRLVTDYYPMFSQLHPTSLWQGEMLARRSARRAAGFLVSSQWAARSLEEDYGVDRGRLRVAPFGPGVRPSSAPSAPVRGQPLRLLLVASDWVRKSGDAALEVLAALRRDGVDVELTVVGEAPSHVPGLVRLGRVERRRMAEVYAHHHLLLETAAANAGGVTLTDATAAGLPVVATRTGGVADIVDDGTTGILVEPERVVEQSVGAVRALGQPDAWTRASEAARRRGRDVLSWDVWADTAVGFCRRLLEGSH